jgi:hypothetical protein
MADDAPAASSGAPAAATDHEFSAHIQPPVPAGGVSRKSTWNKDITDVHVSGTQTPMSVNRLSRIEPGLEEYFVRHFLLPNGIIAN